MRPIILGYFCPTITMEVSTFRPAAARRCACLIYHPWSDGQLLADTGFHNWFGNGPNDANGQDCAVMWWETKFQWDDVSCNHKTQVVCELFTG